MPDDEIQFCEPPWWEAALAAPTGSEKTFHSPSASPIYPYAKSEPLAKKLVVENVDLKVKVTFTSKDLLDHVRRELPFHRYLGASFGLN